MQNWTRFLNDKSVARKSPFLGFVGGVSRNQKDYVALIIAVKQSETSTRCRRVVGIAVHRGLLELAGLDLQVICEQKTNRDKSVCLFMRLYGGCKWVCCDLRALSLSKTSKIFGEEYAFSSVSDYIYVMQYSWKNVSIFNVNNCSFVKQGIVVFMSHSGRRLTQSLGSELKDMINNLAWGAIKDE